MSGLAKVYLLWHVHHQAEEDGEVWHFTHPDDFWSDEEAGDDVKHLGTYSSRERAQERIERARTLPGFADEPNCFYIEEAVIDEDHWTEGYISES
ncbi:hypothetical protein ACFYZ8_19095 [Streptomyces sp. NPDC001668]|uniref:DUF7336 domain-containing protein n=1 Tax=unclassified Streptomyces TaxID=2593676 RepID=UPI0036A8F97C